MGIRKRARVVVRVVMLALLLVLVLQALAYGISFFADPVSGLEEFASPLPVEDQDLAVGLIGLLGVGMMGVAVALMWAMPLIGRGHPLGPRISMMIGVVYVFAGMSVVRVGWVWDAWFYSVSGSLLILFSAALRWLRSSAPAT
ncbi:MAG: hypothetical protein ACPGPI_08260 [Longimicrobiales bacterium]